MRYLKICGAYTYRLTRKHSTIFLASCFLVALTLVLQLYASRHHDHHLSHHPSGDYEYKPGAFLKGQQPNENITYCQFNYGLPETLNWESFTPYPPPDEGEKSHYRVILNAIKSTAYDNVSSYDTVTYVTQATPEFLYHIVEIARYWDGPVSLSVYVPNYDLDITMQIMDQLCRCYPGMAKVSLHLFYNKAHPPKLKRDPMFVTTPTTTTVNETVEEALKRKIESFKNLTNETRAAYIQNSIKNKIKRMMLKANPPPRTSAPYLKFDDCSGLESYELPTYRRLNNLLYPINVGRNSARQGSRTNYFLVSDIELVPSEGLAIKFDKMLRRLMGDKKREVGSVIPSTVFVVPLFEVEKGEHIPREKETLVSLVSEKRAMYFHQTTCTHCQRFPGMQTWLQKAATDDVEPMLIARREYPYHRWEPLYFGTNRDPWYSEVLTWEGQQDKMTQMLELCLRDYRMVILDGAFLCHAARDLKTKNHYVRAEKANAVHYAKIIEKLKRKYKVKNQCKIYHGFKIKR